MVFAYAARACAVPPTNDPPSDAANPEPSPTASQSTISGGVPHGVWLDISSISAIIGPRPGFAYSTLWNFDSVYWSGAAAYPKRGPRYSSAARPYTRS